ncbi:hypothetical protein CRG98_000717 [Punica granatum]|uniref:Reverse transcriptase domain-containing protein n=1 Tax=Punica granatum TaxID=22663 RepID=A0A2I0LF66_PUNGR|nr:hypothetical protein CRG98_000717 [Punica granatum]
MSHNSAKSIPEGATELADSIIFIEAMMSEMMSVMRLEFEHVHERIDLMENKRVEQPRNAPNARRRERVQPRGVRVEDEENYGAGFDEDDRDSVEYEDVFPEETPHGLPPIRGIEHQIDFAPGATIPNRSAYRSNPKETKELQR